MTTGQEWQFKPYKWKEPKELFHNGTPEHSRSNLLSSKAAIC